MKTKRIDEKLFEKQSASVKALQKQSRKELRLIQRAKWKAEHAEDQYDPAQALDPNS